MTAPATQCSPLSFTGIQFFCGIVFCSPLQDSQTHLRSLDDCYWSKQHQNNIWSMTAAISHRNFEKRPRTQRVLLSQTIPNIGFGYHHLLERALQHSHR
jgi:hypothetical protein